jgi:hypothetical protein
VSHSSAGMSHVPRRYSVIVHGGAGARVDEVGGIRTAVGVERMSAVTEVVVQYSTTRALKK